MAGLSDMFLASPTLFCTKGLLFPTLFLIGTNLRYPIYFSPTTVSTLIHVSSYPEAAVGWHQHNSYYGFNYTDFSGKKQKVKESFFKIPTQLQTKPFIILLYYIDTDEILGFFLLLKNHIFIACSEDTIFIFHV